VTPSRSPAWLRLVPQSCRPALGLPSLPPSLAFPSLRSDPAAWTPTGRLGSGRGRLGASDEGTGQVWGWRELPPGRGARRARPRGAPFAAALVASRGEPRKGGGRRGGQCQAGLLRAGVLAVRPSLVAGQPPAQPRGAPGNSCCGPTAAPAGPPAHTCPWEVRPRLPHGASGRESLLPWREPGLDQARGKVEP
jgi:hypothetical protein